MAGDWIPMRTDLKSDPAVIAIATKVGLDTDQVLGKLYRIWSWANVQTLDGKVSGVTLDWIDSEIKPPGFAAAMVEVGWLAETSTGIKFPHFLRYNGKCAKRRMADSRRKMSAREADKMRTKCGLEKRREEKRTTTIEAVVFALAEAGIGEPTRSRIAALPGITIQRIRDTRDKYSGGLFVNAIMALCDKKPTSQTADIPDVSPRLAAQRAEDVKVMAERASQQEPEQCPHK